MPLPPGSSFFYIPLTSSDMSLPAVPPPENLQLQSPLMRLPAEIKHNIFAWCFLTDRSILDPIIGCTTDQLDSTYVPDPLVDCTSGQLHRPVILNLGISLLQTCRRAYHEADRRLLIAQNAFRFSSVDRALAFLRHLPDDLGVYVQDIEIHAHTRRRKEQPSFIYEWLHFVAWNLGPWAELLRSFPRHAPGLKCLRLNFESWPTIPLRTTDLWKCLRKMLFKIEGLERIVVTGASKGRGMAKREPWSVVHFVGGDEVGLNDLIPRMISAVKGSDDSKMIRWVRERGTMQLEVVSTEYLLRCVDGDWSGPSRRVNHKDPWPENGSCTLLQYQNRNLEVTESRTKDINPSAAG